MRHENSSELEFNIRAIARKLMGIMRKHVGTKNGIAKAALFRHVYGYKFDEDQLEDLTRWDIVARATCLLRKESNCFIVRKAMDKPHQTFYFVVATLADATDYREMLSGRIKGARFMNKRVIKAIQESWHKNPFKFDEE